MCPYNKSITDCPCMKDCPRHGMCCACVAHHKQMAATKPAGEAKLPACLREVEWGK